MWEYLLGGIEAGDLLTRTTPTATATVVADAGNTVSTFVTDLSETADQHWQHAIVSFSSGVLLGQVRRVSSYDGATKAITIAGALTSVPVAGSTFVLVNR